MSIWFGGILLILIENIINAKSGIDIISTVAGGVVFASFGYLIMTVAFKFESKKSKKFFNELFLKK
jgi:hypothetical protein